MRMHNMLGMGLSAQLIWYHSHKPVPTPAWLMYKELVWQTITTSLQLAQADLSAFKFYALHKCERVWCHAYASYVHPAMT